MIYDPAHTESKHRAIQDSKPGPSFAMRKCTGGCKRSRSVGQFAPGSTVCIRCARRSKP